jgi:hypothetical protein
MLWGRADYTEGLRVLPVGVSSRVPDTLLNGPNSRISRCPEERGQATRLRRICGSPGTGAINEYREAMRSWPSSISAEPWAVGAGRKQFATS